MLFIGSRRECFFDDYLIDTEKTTAEFRIHTPVRREVVMTLDAPWEGDGSTCQHLVRDEDGYKMYYIGRNMDKATSNDAELLYVNCVATSKDGFHWERPVLRLREVDGSAENNIISVRDSNKPELISTNLSPFYDENPDCPPDERYKTLQVTYSNGPLPQLWLVPSADGIHFDESKAIFVAEGDHYDSMACCFWDHEAKKYRLYTRGYHVPDQYRHMFSDPNGHDRKSYTQWRRRDIRYLESQDGKTWSKSKLVHFTNGVDEEVELYENKVQPYYRAPHIYIGFPTRYNGRCYNGANGWTPNYDQLCGVEGRRARYARESRFGLAVTDCAFMASHDGERFYRHEDAFLTPGPENGYNWKYGDCYPAWGMLETPSEVEGEGKEISLLVPTKSWHNVPVEVVRYSLRLDGFASMRAPGREERVLVTKPFVYEGQALYANLATSAMGYLYFELKTEDGVSVRSYEIFGDATDKRISFFEPQMVAELSGKPVTLTVRMRDADLYAIRFGGAQN